MSRRLRVPGERDVRASLDEPESDSEPDGDGGSDGDSGRADADQEESGVTGACVVACPPHPRHGGTRSDGRLRAVSDALTADGVACLRFDYGPWDGGAGECRDARNALSWAAERYERVGLFGYSFGGAVALLAAAGEPTLAAVSALAPPARLAADLDAVGALDEITCPVQILYGERDETVDTGSLADRATDLGHPVVALPADHHFVGRREEVARLVAEFLSSHVAIAD